MENKTPDFSRQLYCNIKVENDLRNICRQLYYDIKVESRSCIICRRLSCKIILEEIKVDETKNILFYSLLCLKAK